MRAKITKAKYRITVCQLAKRPLAELRKHYSQLQKRERAAIARGDTKAATQLDVLERIAGDAIFEREFGPVLCGVKKR